MTDDRWAGEVTRPSGDHQPWSHGQPPLLQHQALTASSSFIYLLLTVSFVGRGMGPVSMFPRLGAIS